MNKLERLRRLLKPANQARILRVFVVPWLQNVRGQRSYNILTESELRSTRKADTLFIFGSGYSINEVTSSEWSHFKQHDTLSFNWFSHQRFVRIDYHLIREICRDVLNPVVWKPRLEEYSRLLNESPYYADTVFLVHAGLRATMGNRLIGQKRLRAGARVFRFHNITDTDNPQPSHSLSSGLFHWGTLTDCVNFAYLLGWKQIVLVGVDLYDHRYFWLGSEELRDDDRQLGISHTNRHYMADVTLSIMSEWHELLAKQGIQLCVHNPRSLLAQLMPRYQ